MSGNFKFDVGTFMVNKYLDKKIFEVVKVVFLNPGQVEPHFQLRDTEGELWVAELSDMYSRFTILPDQTAARILYSNSVGGTR